MTNQTLPGSNLPDMIKNAVARRKAIQASWSRVQSTESTLRQQLISFSASDTNQVRVEHPLTQTVEQGMPGALQRLKDAVGKMHLERDAITACRARRQTIQCYIAHLKVKRDFQIKLGLWLMILLIGFYIFLKAIDKSAILAAEGEDAVQAADESAINQRLEAARGDALSILSKIQQFIRQHFQNFRRTVTLGVRSLPPSPPSCAQTGRKLAGKRMTSKTRGACRSS
jgi:hypothetical protein